jgi:hypothetical protein
MGQAPDKAAPANPAAAMPPGMSAGMGPSIVIRKPSKTPWLKMLIYGDPGVGKTTFGVTAQAHELTREVLLVSIEGGELAVTDAEAVGIPSIPDMAELTKYEQFQQVFWYLQKGDHPYKTVVIDTLSELQRMNLDSIVGRQLNKASGSGAKHQDLDDIWQEDFGTSAGQMSRLVRSFRSLPMNVVFTCHAASKVDAAKNETVFPALTPKLRGFVIGYVDVVGYMFTQSVQAPNGAPAGTLRRMLFRPTQKFLAKDRTPGEKLGMVMDNPTIPKVMDILLGKKQV